ncbi:MAG: hypothetical protein GX621_04160, partial [Pirellulaceae bacterium]|nr:hypothetical protein [Pirellulaceae bacterium]
MRVESNQNNSNEPVSPAAATIADGIGSPTPRESADSSLLTTRGHGAVAVVEGTGPQLSGETHSLLRSRPRAAALLLSIGMAVALVPHWVHGNFSQTAAVVLFSLHAGMVVVLGLIAWALYLGRVVSLTGLRAIELTIFGLPSLFFLVTEYYWTLDCCRDGR